MNKPMLTFKSVEYQSRFYLCRAVNGILNEKNITNLMYSSENDMVEFTVPDYTFALSTFLFETTLKEITLSEYSKNALRGYASRLTDY